MATNATDFEYVNDFEGSIDFKIGSAGYNTLSATQAKTGSQSFRTHGYNGDTPQERAGYGNFSSAKTEIWLACWYYDSDIKDLKDSVIMALYSEGLVPADHEGLALMIDEGCDIKYRIAGGTAVATGATISGTTWHHFEIHAKMGEAGSSELDIWLDGIPIVSGASPDLTNSGAFSDWDTWVINWHIDKTDESFVDDFIVANDGRIHNCQLTGRYPTSDGTHGDMTPSTGVDNYAVVDDESDSEYLYGDGAAVEETFNYDNISNVGTIKSVFQIVKTLWFAGTTATQISRLSRKSTTDYTGAAGDINVEGHVIQIMNNDPATSAEWTSAGLDATEFGVKFT